MTNPLSGIDKQPISAVSWVSPEELRGNDYNPNKVFPPELELLKTSILLSGWTQPIVARVDGEIVDGFHRWTIGKTAAEIIRMTDGLVPVVRARTDLSAAEQRMATIRHNRARGEHSVLKMSAIVASLIDEHQLTSADVAELLSMEDEEVDRLYDRSTMKVRGDTAGHFNEAWVPE